MSTPYLPQDGTSYPSDCQLLEKYRSRVRENNEHKIHNEDQPLFAKAEPLQLLLLDVDGVLTDGSLIYTENGSEAKAFNTQDGLGIRLLQKAGVNVGLITARRSDLVYRRARELDFRHIKQGIDNKVDAYKEIIRREQLKPYQVCYMGDDWIDLPLLTKVGLAACPANSVPEVKEACHFITGRPGGYGAVREVCTLILKAKGELDNLLQTCRG
ncbi:MAG: 3-deoxy-D-manno-octulosonate 8-phosphate phosphatase [Proteobacteria bacterium]|nr:MAG: 3-deoxy-D-manno-octulosonate 8-phosphate phosphatase [Pseudomonadota bacterium]